MKIIQTPITTWVRDCTDIKQCHRENPPLFCGAGAGAGVTSGDGASSGVDGDSFGGDVVGSRDGAGGVDPVRSQFVVGPSAEEYAQVQLRSVPLLFT